MINLLNFGDLSTTRRQQIALRAIHTQPYFYKFEFPVLAGATPQTQYSANVGINRDFYLTDVQSNFGEAFTATGSLFDMSLWTNYQRSLYRWQTSSKLPTPFLSYEARFQTPVNQEKFDDRQFEYKPLLIRNGDKIFAEIENADTKNAGTDIYVILKGFNLLTNVFLDPRETEQINNSIAAPVSPELLKFEVTETGRRSFVITNDNRPRLILGFGATNRDEAKTLVPEVKISIQDLSRRLNLTDTAIPLEFIAPRLTCLLDQHRYWLPTEYYFPPFAKLAFDVDATFQQSGNGVEINLLTRTI